METLSTNPDQAALIVWGIRTALIVLPTVAGIFTDLNINYVRSARGQDRLPPYTTFALFMFGLAINTIGFSPQ